MPAQKLFRDGYIVKKDGVALEGMLGFTPGQDFPSACIFKRFEIAVQVKYSVEELKAFGYRNGRRFEIFNLTGKPAVYEALVKGDLSVYRKGLNFYIGRKNDAPVQLVSDTSMILVDNGEKKEFKTERAILLYLTLGRGAEVKIDFDMKNDLVPLVTEFNSRGSSKYYVYQDNFNEKDLVANVRRAGINKNTFGLIGGTNYYLFNIKGTGGIYAPKSMNQMWPVYGILYERVISTRSDKVALHAELQYFRHNFYEYSETEKPYLGTERNDAFVDLTGLNMPLLIQYSFRGARIVPYVNAGLTFTGYLKRKYTHIYEFEDVNNNINTTEDHLVTLKPLEASGTAGLGISVRVIRMISIRIEGRFEAGFGPVKKIPNVTCGFKEKSIQESLLFGISF